MKRRKTPIFLSTIFTVLVFIMNYSAAYADPGEWVLPWRAYDHNLMSSAVVFNSDVSDYVGKVNSGQYGTGYWHYMFVSFDYSLPYYLQLIAPAGGVVFQSSKSNLYVQTDDGDIYGVQLYGNSDSMETFYEGERINTGDEIGEVYLLTQEPKLEVIYFFRSEPDTLFGEPTWKFVDGADLTDLSCNTYGTAGSTVEVDLLLENMVRWGGVYDAYAYKPNYPISFNAVVKLDGNLTSGGFWIRWTVTGENNYQHDDYIWCEAENNPTNPEPHEFVWTPPHNGTFWIYCKLDPYKDIPESNEANNDNWDNPWEISVDDFTGDAGVTIGN